MARRSPSTARRGPFYGAVGRASTSGIDFILIYTGPALVVVLGYPMLRKMGAARQAAQRHLDRRFPGARYGKSRVVGVSPPCSPPWACCPTSRSSSRAVSSTFKTIAEPTPWARRLAGVVHTDTSLIVAALMAVFTILFGVRNVRASEQHRGMMMAIAFRSVVKAAGVADRRAVRAVCPVRRAGRPAGAGRAVPAVADRSREGSPLTWVVTTLLSGMAFLCLPRQFHRRRGRARPSGQPRDRALAVPLPGAGQPFRLADRGGGPAAARAAGQPGDVFVLQLPIEHGQSWLSAFVFIGGLSAATSMVIVACMALSA